MAFDAQEKVKIRHHLGYLNVTNAATFALGIPQAVETQFIIENAMNLVLPEAEGEARRHINILNGIEELMICGHENLAINAIGEIKIREDEQEALDKRYHHWRNALANVLGVYPNPFDKRFYSATGAGGINVRVKH